MTNGDTRDHSIIWAKSPTSCPVHPLMISFLITQAQESINQIITFLPVIPWVHQPETRRLPVRRVEPCLAALAPGTPALSREQRKNRPKSRFSDRALSTQRGDLALTPASLAASRWRMIVPLIYPACFRGLDTFIRPH